MNVTQNNFDNAKFGSNISNKESIRFDQANTLNYAYP